ncbi:hypothetical protein FRC07_011689 [Ceratobasidium sp. 392]|nr:hypothetical protein FRC07_011689 [Ceratobasidium sp. 392]
MELAWGSSFSEYSQRQFEPRGKSETSQEEFEKFYDVHGVPPVSSVEDLLYGVSSGVDILGPTEAEATIFTLRKYMAATKRKDFAKAKSKVRKPILQPICMAAPEDEIYWPSGFNRIASSEDSRAVSQVFAGLLFVWRRDGWSTKALPIEFMGHLVVFVQHLTGFNPSTTVQDLMETVHTALQFLWMVFEDRGRIPVSDHSHLRQFLAGSAFSYLSTIQSGISTPTQQRRFAQMLADIEIIELAGRVLLLVQDEGNEFKNIEGFNDFIYKLEVFQEVMDESASAFPELFYNSKTQWQKVLARLGRLTETGDTKQSY